MSDNRNYDITHGSYAALLFDKRWKEKRQRILLRDHYRCTVCGSNKDLTVHHTQYHVNKDGQRFVPWDYDDKYLKTLCKRCYNAGQAKYKVPTFIITKKY